MTKTEALEGSIRKWKRIVRSPKALEVGGDNCLLCEKYGEDDCRGCPVNTITNSGCNKSPYDDWITHTKDYHNQFCLERHRVPHCKECIRLAKEELAFLESLR